MLRWRCGGDLLTLRQLQLPVTLVVFNNSSLGFVELEMNQPGWSTTAQTWSIRILQSWQCLPITFAIELRVKNPRNLCLPLMWS
jgi:hypothetical protein